MNRRISTITAVSVFAVMLGLLDATNVSAEMLMPAPIPIDRSETGDVYTSGISGVDQRGIILTGPSATDWMGLSRSPAYWVADRDSNSAVTIRTQSASGASAGDGTSWGWLGLLGLVGLAGLFNRSRQR